MTRAEISENNKLASSLSCKERERIMSYKQPTAEQENSQRFVLDKFDFVKKSPELLEILERLSWKYNLSLYDTAMLAGAVFNAKQDVFNALSFIDFGKSHFVNVGRPILFQRLGFHKARIGEVHTELDMALKNKNAKKYFEAIKRAQEIGSDILKYLYLRSLRIVTPKKRSFNDFI